MIGHAIVTQLTVVSWKMIAMNAVEINLIKNLKMAAIAGLAAITKMIFCCC